MKNIWKSILLVAMLLLPMQSNAQNIVPDGTNYVLKSSSKDNTSSKVKTTITIKDEVSNRVYPIYIGKTGACYFMRISKKGSEYPVYLGEEYSKEICKRYNHPYTSSKRK